MLLVQNTIYKGINLLKQGIAVLKKDLKSEFRTRYALSSVILFVLIAVSVLLFSLTGEKINVEISSALLWVIMFFGSMSGLSRGFVSEYERSTMMLLELSAGNNPIYIGKYAFNVFLSLVINICSSLLFFLLLSPPPLKMPVAFIILIFLAALGLASSTTIISAIISAARGKNSLFPILSLPVTLPLILIGVETTQWCFNGTETISMLRNFTVILAYSVILTTASFLLYDFIRDE